MRQRQPNLQRLRCYQASPSMAILIDEAVGYNAQNPAPIRYNAVSSSRSSIDRWRCVMRFCGNGEANSGPSSSCMGSSSVWTTDLSTEEDAIYTSPYFPLSSISQNEVAKAQVALAWLVRCPGRRPSPQRCGSTVAGVTRRVAWCGSGGKSDLCLSRG